jgi:3-isopropylmalate dehydrogenase
MKNELRIAVLPGDGIGVEVMDACLAVLEAVQRKIGGFRLATEVLPGGAALYSATGTAFSEENFRKTEAADAILFGAMGLPEVRHPDGTEIAPHLEMRREYGLYAGVRPVKAFANCRTPLADPRAAEIELVILRESTEGLFASRGLGTVEDDRVARDTMVISRSTCERLFDFAFRLAARRRSRGLRRGRGPAGERDRGRLSNRCGAPDRAGRQPDHDRGRQGAHPAPLTEMGKTWASGSTS